MFTEKQKQIINAKLKDAIKQNQQNPKNCYFDKEPNHIQKAIKSHSIWNSGILNLLANKNKKVYWIDPKKRYKLFGEDEKLFHEVTINNATTYRGFCNFHDENLFKSIEKNNEYNNTLIQNFLYSYRAFSFQHVQNILSNFAYRDLAKEIRTMHSSNIAEFKVIHVFFIEKILENIKKPKWDKIFQETKDIFHNTFIEFTNDNIELFINKINRNFILKSYKFSKKIKFACSGIGDPLLDGKGNKIHTTESGFLFLNIFPKCENESYLIIGLLNRDLKVYKDLLDFIDSEYKNYLNNEQNIFELVIQNLVVNSTENIVMAPKLHSSLIKQDNLNKFERQFKSCFSLIPEEEKFYQNLKNEHGYSLF